VTLVEAGAREHLGALLAAKGSRRIGVYIPARDEGSTIGAIVDDVAALRDAGLVDELVVVDDGSHDDTALEAAAAGAQVVPSPHGPGKGQALRAALAATDADLAVFLDADVANFSTRFVSDLVAPLLTEPDVQLVKARYRRPLDGRADEGGRVTELLARPLLRRLFPPLASIAQPLAGECAIRRTALDDLVLADGYGIEIGLLIDVHRRFGRDAIAEVLAAVLDRRTPCPHETGDHP
jgi:glucosyl-3-phosphoglycerate synthase